MAEHPLGNVPSQAHLLLICRFGKGPACCSFLVFDPSRGGFSCVKGSPLEMTIYARIASGTITAKGDGCDGPPNFQPLVP